MGLLTQNDATIFRGFFKEMAKLRGIPCLYRYVVSQDVTVNSEFLYKLSEPINMDIIFNENPTISTLRRIGWISENSDDKPYIAQIPFDAPNVQVGCTISLLDFDLDSRRDFKITSLKMLMEFPDCWTCTLAPIFYTNDAKSEYKETNYNYLYTPDADISNDAPDNDEGREYVIHQIIDEKGPTYVDPDKPKKRKSDGENNFSYLNLGNK